jgi:hypothetical protein
MLSITRFSIKGLIGTLSMNDILHDNGIPLC